MTNRDSIYRCPVCNKPFDTTDGLFDFAIAAHEKDHQADRNSLRNLIRLNDSGTWQCMLCGHGLGLHEEAARLAVIGHVSEIHGVLPASSFPVVTRDGRGRARDVIDEAAGIALKFLRNFTDSVS